MKNTRGGTVLSAIFLPHNFRSRNPFHIFNFSFCPVFLDMSKLYEVIKKAVSDERADDEQALIQIIESELAHSKDTGKNFCLLRCHVPVSELKLAYTPEVSVSGYYVFDISNLSNLNGTECSVRRVDKPEMLEDILRMDLEHDEESLGRDFCTRRIYRRKDIYLSDGGVDSYICYNNAGEAVGSCDLFIYGDTAKIEDFSVSPQHQRKGYGTSLLKALIETAAARDVTAVHLETDEDDTAKEMYKKCGFYKAGEFTDLFFML